MTNKAVSLSESPGAFLDAGRWRELSAIQGGATAAMDLLSLTAAGHMRVAIEAVKNNPSIADKARLALRAHDLRDQLLAEFRVQLDRGRLIATGITSEGRRIEIPSELWAELHIDF